ncbi:MAG: FAD synthetase family protein [Clostridiales bacterium]|jgi:riboflavin kinase/FMN adenylyltransferase|nr:FAD synthetase family protein [Clostridiales bacterium]
MRVYQVEQMEGIFDTPTVICLGVFDGVHLGHQRLIQEALEVARRQDLLAMVHTYDVLPAQVIYPDRRIQALTSLEERTALIEAAGIEDIAVNAFTSQLQKASGAAFFQEVLRGKLNARHLVVGFNHRFGFRGDTDVHTLEDLCKQAGIGLSVIQPVRTREGNLVSSSAIRSALLLDDVELAEEMLGRPLSPSMKQWVSSEHTLHPFSISTEV